MTRVLPSLPGPGPRVVSASALRAATLIPPANSPVLVDHGGVLVPVVGYRVERTAGEPPALVLILTTPGRPDAAD